MPLQGLRATGAGHEEGFHESTGRTEAQLQHFAPRQSARQDSQC